MKTEIISIGTEITTGAILNTNSYYLSKNLLDMGIETTYQTSVSDNHDDINEVLEIALKRADLIITTGGLGPTEDDRTKEVIAEHLGLKLVEDVNEINKIKEIFKDREYIPENNFKQGIRIENSIFLNNENGTASGIYLEHNNKKIILLPGPPRELMPMFDNEVKPLIKEEEIFIITKSVNVTNIGESQLELDIIDIIHKYDDIEVATFAKPDNVEVKLIARGNDKKILEDKISEILLELENRFKLNLFAYDNKPIEEVVLEMLKENELKIGTAESCTGGLLASKITSISGSSEIFDRGKITYSNLSKMEELGVKESTLKTYGAVSEETAREMLIGLLDTSNIDFGISITGIAGPNSDETNKPVGLVYMAIGNYKDMEIKKYNFKGNRKYIQNRVGEKAIFNIREYIIKDY